MPMWLKAASVWGSVIAIIALVIILLKQLIAFVGFITVAIKILIAVAFIAMFIAVGYMAFRAWQSKRKNED
jgi:hypothetical protein